MDEQVRQVLINAKVLAGEMLDIGNDIKEDDQEAALRRAMETQELANDVYSAVCQLLEEADAE